MSLSYWTANLHVAIERNTPTKDAVGAQVDHWAVYVWNMGTGDTTESLPVKRNPLVGADNKSRSDMGRPDGTRYVDWCFDRNYECKVGDRIKYIDPKTSAVAYYRVDGLPANYDGHPSRRGNLAPYVVTTILKDF